MRRCPTKPCELHHFWKSKGGWPVESTLASDAQCAFSSLDERGIGWSNRRTLQGLKGRDGLKSCSALSLPTKDEFHTTMFGIEYLLLSYLCRLPPRECHAPACFQEFQFQGSCFSFECKKHMSRLLITTSDDCWT
jgi:hypothetical protein